MARLFVAVYPPTDVVDALARLPHDATDGVRWVPPEQYHVTLRFLGDTDPESVGVALGAALADAAPAAVVLGPRVSRLGRNIVCVPSTGLAGLAAAVATATSELGQPPDPRPFRGHVTLARLRGRAACGLAGARFDARFEAREVHLVSSTTRAEGAEHIPVRSWQLTV